MYTYTRHFEVRAQCAEVVVTEGKCGCVEGMTFGGPGWGFGDWNLTSLIGCGTSMAPAAVTENTGK